VAGGGGGVYNTRDGVVLSSSSDEDGPLGRGCALVAGTRLVRVDGRCGTHVTQCAIDDGVGGGGGGAPVDGAIMMMHDNDQVEEDGHERRRYKWKASGDTCDCVLARSAVARAGE